MKKQTTITRNESPGTNWVPVAAVAAAAVVCLIAMVLLSNVSVVSFP